MSSPQGDVNVPQCHVAANCTTNYAKGAEENFAQSLWRGVEGGCGGGGGLHLRPLVLTGDLASIKPSGWHLASVLGARRSALALKPALSRALTLQHGIQIAVNNHFWVARCPLPRDGIP